MIEIIELPADASEVEQDIHPLVLAAQIAALTDQLHVSLSVGGEWGGDYAALLGHLRATTSHLADCNAQLTADADRDGNGEAKSASGHAEWHFGQAAHWLDVTGGLIADEPHTEITA